MEAYEVQNLIFSPTTFKVTSFHRHACGENPSGAYSQTRMDSAWNFRNAYNEAKKIKSAQDEFCGAVERGFWDKKSEFPESPLKWESLVDVLRGRVKVRNFFAHV